MEDYPENPGFLPGNSGIQETYREIQETRRPTKKSKDDFPDFVGNIRMQSEMFHDFSEFCSIIQDLSRLLLEVLNSKFPRFGRNFWDAVRDFPGFSKILDIILYPQK